MSFLIVKDATRNKSYLKVVEKLRSRLTTWPCQKWSNLPVSIKIIK
jgi:hypothetical protein